MTEHTSPSLRDLVIRTFATIEAKDQEAMMRLFADDAVLIDPHFPTPQMHLNNCMAMGSKRSLRQAEVFLRRKQARTTQNVDSMVWQMAKPR